jgi:RNA polymerase sigma factor (sigma-70 family)
MGMKSLATESDWHLMQQGNEAAFQRLHQQHIRHLLNYGLRLYGSLSVVEDAVQELFLDIWQNRRTLNEPDSIRFYLLRATRNKLSRQYRRDQPFVPDWNESLEYPFAVEPSSEQRWIDLDIADQQRDRIQAAMRMLSPRQREILYLRYFNDLNYEQICELTGLSYQSARSQVYQALKAMRTILDLRNFSVLILLIRSFSEIWPAHLHDL